LGSVVLQASDGALTAGLGFGGVAGP